MIVMRSTNVFLLFFTFLFTLFRYTQQQFYRGELEPRYSRKTPFRQQNDLPNPVFGIGHGQRFASDENREKSNEDFFGHREKHEPERSSILNAGRHDSEENGDNHFRRGPAGKRPRFEEHTAVFGEEENEGGFRRPTLPDSREVRARFDKERGRDKAERGVEKPEERNQDAEKRKSKIVGLNMQVVAGVYPKHDHEPSVDVESKSKPARFFRPDNEDEHEPDREHRRDSGEIPNERGRDGEGKQERNGSGEQQQQQQPPPPKPQIPPFPPFPKFPGFGGFQPFQPDFPSRKLDGAGGFESGAWNEPSRSSRRPATSRENAGADEERSGTNRPHASHESHHSSPSTPNDSRPSDERDRHSGGRDYRGRESEEHHGNNEKVDEKRNGYQSSEEEREQKPEKRKIKKHQSEENVDQEEENRLGKKIEFPTPGRFINSRQRNAENVTAATTASPTTSPTYSTVPVILPTEEINLESTTHANISDGGKHQFV